MLEIMLFFAHCIVLFFPYVFFFSTEGFVTCTWIPFSTEFLWIQYSFVIVQSSKNREYEHVDNSDLFLKGKSRQNQNIRVWRDFIAFQGHPEAELMSVFSTPSYMHLQQWLFHEWIENKSQAHCGKSTKRDEFHVCFEIYYSKRNYIKLKLFRLWKIRCSFWRTAVTVQILFH